LIKEEAERLSRIVEDLFMLARQPVDAPSLIRERVRLDELVSDCFRAAQVLATKKGLRLNFDGTLPAITVHATTRC